MKLFTAAIGIVILVLSGICEVKSQYPDEVVWADSVISYSSQYSETSGSAKQILGKPSSTSVQGLSPTSWIPAKEKNFQGESIHVSFPKAVKARQITVYQNQNPGAITSILGYSDQGNEYNLYTNPDIYYYQREADILKVVVDNPPEESIRSVKLIMDTRRISGYNSIDAIAISSEELDIGYGINLDKDFSKADISGKALGSTINSPFSELAPIISSDGSTLYFTRKGHPSNLGPMKMENIWVSQQGSDGKFKEAELLPGTLNNEGSNYAIAVTQDNNTMIVANVYEGNGKMTPGFSSAVNEGGKWVKPKELKIRDYVNIAKQSSFYISYDGLYLFSSINDGNSYGGVDIYVSEKQEDGSWSKPKNLGPDINTAADEVTPFLTADGKRLYFSSNGWPGFGGYDVFASDKRENLGSWSEPVNLGSGINGLNWELFFSIPLATENAFYVSNSNSKGNEDIYTIDIPASLYAPDVYTVAGYVRDDKTGKPIQADIYYEDLETGEKLGTASSNSEDGLFSIVLLPGKIYGVRAEAEGYIAINDKIDLSGYPEDKNQSIDLTLVAIEKGASVTLNNIFFEFGESELLASSFSELGRVVKLMEKNPDIEITIQGHTDNIGSDERNKQVSLDRAEAVRSYLISKGISSERISAKGMGDSQPVADNSTEAGRALNRRVEFIID